MNSLLWMVFWTATAVFLIYLVRLELRDLHTPDSEWGDIRGEGKGTTSFYGMPNRDETTRDVTDTISQSLAKIKWLSNSNSREIHWRISLILAMSLSVVTTLILQMRMPTIREFFMFTFIAWAILYKTSFYYDYHRDSHVSKYILAHLKSIREKLSIPVTFEPICVGEKCVDT